MKAAGENVGPAIVAVGGGAMAVGDGVAEGDDGSCGGRGLHIDFGDLVPVIDVFGIGERGSADEVAVRVEGGCTRARVSGLASRRRLQV